MSVPWNDIAKMIIKASDNIQRGVENASTEDAEVVQNTNPAQTTVNSEEKTSNVSLKGYEPPATETADTSEVFKFSNAGKEIGSNLINQINDTESEDTKGKSNGFEK